MRILDVGSGAAPWLDDANLTIHLDVYRSLGVTALGNALRLPFRDGSFDHVVARQVVEHIPTAAVGARQEPFYQFFDELWRVLRRDGTCRVETPHVRSPNAFADPTHRRFFVPRTFGPLWDAERDPHYPRRPWIWLGLRVTRENWRPSNILLDLRRGDDWSVRYLRSDFTPSLTERLGARP